MHENTIQYKLNEIFQKYAKSTAIEYGDKIFSYKKLDEKSNFTANYLTAKGVRKGAFVGVFAEDKAAIIAMAIGIIKAGCVFVPLDPNYPQKRLEAMISTSDTTLVLTDGASLEKLTELYTSEGKRVEIAEIGDLFNKNLALKYSGVECDKLSERIEYAPDDSIYVYFTSGSTGTPKAILGRNASLLHFINWEIETFEVNNETKVSQLTSQCHDPYLRDIFVPLCAGGTVCIPKSKEVMLETRSLIDWIEAARVKLIHCTPSLFRVFNSELLTGDSFKGLKNILLAGEKINPTELKNWYDVFNDRIQLVNMYGPTETTLAKLFYPISPSDVDKKIMPIGKPIKGARIAIVDENLKMCPQGIMGEIIIRTPYRTHGYYKNLQMTKEKFIPNPFGKDPNDLVYRTGDLGRILPDGNVEFLGRADKQVKIRGFRIELSEIESALTGYEAVKEAVVTDLQNTARNKYLCAYIVVDSEKAALENKSLSAELREYLAQRLPDYMIPLYFIKLKKMPLTPNGKLDYKALPEPDKTIDDEYVAPRNDSERQLEKIWCDLLEIDRVGINQSFLHVGGHSLNMMTLISRVNQKFQVDLPFKEVFENPTIEKISQLIEKNEKHIYDPIKRTEDKEYYEVSPAQRRLYILSCMEGMDTTYNIPGAVMVEGNLNRERLEDAFVKLAVRQEALRTYFEIVDGEPVQIIHPEPKLELSYLEAESEDISELMLAFIRPFKLSRRPLFRVGLVRLSEERHVLVYDIHHIISDAVSMNILIKEFAKLYQGVELPQPEIRYRDYAIWQNELFKGRRIKKQEDYWLKVFSDEIPVLKLSTDYSRPALQSYEGNKLGFSIDEELTRQLRGMCANSGVTMYMLLFAAYNILLHKYTGQKDIIVGLPIAGRQHSNLENIIGVFINTLAMRNKPEGEKSFGEFLKEVKDNLLKAYENQDYPFEELVEKLSLPRDLSRNPIFDTMFELNTGFEQQLELEGLKFSPCKFEDNIAKLDIRLQGIENEKDVYFELEYCTKLFKKKTIELFAAHFVNILKLISLNKDIKLCEIDMLSDDERNRILFGFNSTDKEFPEDRTIHDLIEEQTAAKPDKIAIKFGKEELTYEQLNAKANRLARFLQKKGLGKESLVAIMLERSTLMVESILGVWKAGGAYIPIDVNYPVQRVKEIVEDSGARFILSNAEYISEELEKELGAKILRLDENITAIEAETDDNLNIKLDTGSLAYVIYTSGSTGKPKGAMVEHIGMMNHMQAKVNDLQLDENCIVAQNASHCFDISVWQFFVALIKGGSTVIYPNELTLKPQEFISSVIADKITILEVVPSFLSVILDCMETQYKELEKISYLLVTGETVKMNLVKKWFELYPSIKMVNAYGPTEASDDITHFIMDKAPDMQSVPIGKPIQNFSIYIVDNSMKLCPVGVTGEICVAGKGVGRGYLNNPQKTAEVFMQNPFPERAGVRLYKTGDLGRWLPDGNLEFFGRKDYQVKIRGFRIELGEIENRLVAHPSLKEAVVVDKQDKGGSTYLCAYIVPESEIEIAEIKDYLLSSLPAYMVPAYFVSLNKMPLTPNGKVDRKALPEPEKNVDTGNTYQAPQTQTERLLADIWQEVLGIEKVGINDNFFDLGGHSLKAIKLISRLNNLAVNININDVFQYQNIREIGRLVDSMAKKENLPDTAEKAEQAIFESFGYRSRLVKYQVNTEEYYVLFIYNAYTKGFYEITDFVKQNFSEKIYPHYIKLVNADEAYETPIFGMEEKEFSALLGLKTRNTKAALQNIMEELEQGEERFRDLVLAKDSKRKYPIAPVQKYSLANSEATGLIIRLDDYVDIAMLNKALTDIIGKHELLRSTLMEENGELLWKEYEAPDNISIPVIDLSDYGMTSRKAALKKIIQTFYYKDYPRFDTLYYRALIVKINLRENLLVLPFSHAIFDAATSEIIKRSLLNSYQLRKLEGVPTDVIKAGYSDYVKQIIKGPQNISEEQLIELLELEEYEQYSRQIDEEVGKYVKGITKVETEIIFNEYGINEDKVWELSFVLAVAFCKRYFGLSRVPMWTMSYGRHYEGNRYFETIGEFVDLVPILATEQNDFELVVNDIQEKLAAISKFNINFANLLYNENMEKTFDKVQSYLKRKLSDRAISFNFQGKLEVDELELNRSLKQRDGNLTIQQENASNIVFTVKYTNEAISFIVNLPYVENKKKLNAILRECLEEIADKISGEDVLKM